MSSSRVADRVLATVRPGFDSATSATNSSSDAGLKRFEARTYHGFAHYVCALDATRSGSRDLLRRAFEAASRIGDLTSGSLYLQPPQLDLLFAASRCPT